MDDGVRNQKVSDSDTSSPNAEVTHVRKSFPETWLWKNTAVPNGDSMVSINAKVPDTITSWTANAFAIHEESGFGVAASKAELQAFQPFFIVLNLPYSVIRGETFVLKAVIFNYFDNNANVDVDVTLAKSTEFHVQKVNIDDNVIETEASSQEVKTTIKVLNGKTGVASFIIVPKTLGNIEIDVLAETTIESDRLKKKVLVKPEGVTKFFNKALFLKLKDSEETKTVDVLVPWDSIVPNSMKADVSVVGDIMGPALKGLDKLLRVPYGCGEQNIITTAPNIFVVKYLTAMERLTEEIREKAVKNINSGYQRELNYKRDDGSFSAFGDSDNSGSTWLTAFVMKSFEHAKFLDSDIIDGDLCSDALKWLMLDNQFNKSDGTFKEPGTIHHQEMLGGSADGALSRTAFIFIAIMETEQCKGTEYSTQLTETKEYLEGTASDPSIKNHYTLAILAYALSLTDSSVAASVIARMFNEATKEAGEMYWPSQRMKDSQENFNAKRGAGHWCAPPQPESLSVETTSYMLLACVKANKKSEGRQILKWLLTQRSAFGGYSSTQDTVLALQAQSEFAELIKGDESTSVEVNVRATSGFTKDFIPLVKDNAMITQSAELPEDVKEVTVKAKGTGVALAQVSWQYNVDELENTVPNYPDWTLTVTQQALTKTKIVVKPCIHYNGLAGMTTLRVSVPSGYQADLTSLDNQENIKRKEMDGEDVVIYYDEVTQTQQCPELQANKIFFVADLKPVAVEVQEYYVPEKTAVAFYKAESDAQISVCDVCIIDCEKHCPTTGAQQVTFSFATLIGLLFFMHSLKNLLCA